jgi:hypothetical protein
MLWTQLRETTKIYLIAVIEQIKYLKKIILKNHDESS